MGQTESFRNLSRILKILIVWNQNQLKGNKPPICIFEYPSLDVKFVLDGGALKAYAHVEFSPDGKLLASLSGTPDYMLTLWNWQKQSIGLFWNLDYTNAQAKVENWVTRNCPSYPDPEIIKARLIICAAYQRGHLSARPDIQSWYLNAKWKDMVD